MRFLLPLLFILGVAACASCGKETNNNATITINGRLQPKVATTYQYGTAILIVDKYTSYLVEATSFTLASYVGDSVQVQVKDMGYRVNPGPELYNVITITPL